MLKTHSKTERLLTLLVTFLIICYLALFTVIDFYGFSRLCTHDMYEDTLVARLMWEQKSLFPHNFLFGNQFYVVATPVFASLFYGITGSMNHAMACATFLMSVFILMSMSWMLHSCLQNSLVCASSILIFMASVFGPYTIFREDGQQLFFAMCSFYSCYLICFFIVLGDYIRARSSSQLRPFPLVLSLLLCFCTGMQSLRQTCILILPMICYECFSLLFDFIRKIPLTFSPCRKRLLAYTAANILGVLFVRFLPVRQHEIYSGASIFSGASFLEKIRDVHTALITVSGFDSVRSSDNKVFFSVLFTVLVLLILAAVYCILRRKSDLHTTGCIWLVSFLGCLSVIAASFVTSVQLRPIYLFLYYILPALSFALISAGFRPRTRSLFILFFCLLAGANLYFSYKDDLRVVFSKSPTAAQQISDWAVENGFELVYGNQSLSAPSVAACSDGALTAGCWQDDFLFKVSTHINIRDIYHINDSDRAIFVFWETEVPSMLAETAANGTEMAFQGQYDYYYVYTASKQCMWPVTELIDYAEKYPEYN